MNGKDNKGKIIGVLLLVAIVAIGGFFVAKGRKVEEPKTSQKDSEVSSNENKNEEKLDKDNDSEKTEKGRMSPFKLKDMEGNEVTEEVFKDYELTIIAAWQTTCGPCYYELEALNEIYEMYKDKGVNVIGLTLDEPGIEKVKEATEELELKYTNLMVEEDYIYEIIKHVTGTPTALFVDKDGNFLREPKVGTRGVEGSVEDFKKIIEEINPSED